MPRRRPTAPAFWSGIGLVADRALNSAVKRRRCGRAITSESGTGERGLGAGAHVALAAEEVLVLFVLINVRSLSPPYSNCPGSTCLTHVGTKGRDQLYNQLPIVRCNQRWPLRSVPDDLSMQNELKVLMLPVFWSFLERFR